MDAPSVRALLANAFPALGHAPDALVARVDGQVVGAAAVAWVPGGFPMSVRVEPDHRRRGVGQALVARVVARVRGETPALRGWRPLQDEEPAARFLLACGFAEDRRLQVYDCPPDAFGDAMTALLTRLRSRVPAEARLVPPGAVPPGALAALLADQLALRQDALSAALSSTRGDADGWDAELSHLLLVDGELAGALLARRHEGHAEVDFNVVAPRYRGGWANVMLIEALVTRVRAAGLASVRFLAEPHVRDTINLSRRSGGVRRPDQVTYSLRL